MGGMGIVREVGVVVLFVEDVERSKAFYRDVMGRPVKYEAEGFAEIEFDNMSVALEEHPWASTREVPALGAHPGEGSHFQFTVWVKDADAALASFGDQVEVVQPPTDQPKFGQRTAIFRDPDGNLWELSATIRAD